MRQQKAPIQDWDAFDNDEDLVPAQSRTKEKQKRVGEKIAQAKDPDAHPLWSTYGIMPSLPASVKIEKLLLYGVTDIIEIAELTEVDEDIAQETVRRINKKWADMALPLSSDDRLLAKGRLIAEFTELLSQMEQLNAAFPDYKHLQFILSLREKMARLRGIDVDKKPIEDMGAPKADHLQTALEGLSEEASRDLVSMLEEDGPTLEPVVEEDEFEPSSSVAPAQDPRPIPAPGHLQYPVLED